MRTERIFAALAIAFLMCNMNLQAQGRGRNDQRGNSREIRVHSNGRVQMHGGNEMRRAPQQKAVRPNYQMDRPMAHHRPASPAVHHRPAPPVVHHHRVDHRGYLPGWNGRVRYLDGRWGYLRHSRWYWYNCYFEPDYYFAHPVSHFHTHISPVAAGAVGGAVLGAFIGALCR